VFPAKKYSLLRDFLLHEGIAGPDDFVEPKPASEADVLRVHTPDYVRKMRTGAFTPTELRTLEVPWSRELQEATWLAAGGAILAGRLARRDGCAILLSGGFHHAFADHGEGFCLVNDVAVAIAALRASGEARRAAVVDLDVHQGNGTAAILGADRDAFTVSIHQENNYPATKPQSHVDIGLLDETGDAEYLKALEEPLRQAIAFRPDVLFYVAGADPFGGDRLGGLALTLEGLRERDLRVLAAARAGRVPVAVCLAGGYAERPADTVRIHIEMVKAAAETFAA
jgi:acetoin utilization deacetylase AcuC-like enzyme